MLYISNVMSPQPRYYIAVKDALIAGYVGETLPDLIPCFHIANIVIIMRIYNSYFK